jgi:DNA-binding NtrC family response regulator
MHAPREGSLAASWVAPTPPPRAEPDTPGRSPPATTGAAVPVADGGRRATREGMTDRPEGSGATHALVRARSELRLRRFRLTVVAGNERGQLLELGADDVSVGSAPGNDLVLSDPAVSRHHFTIVSTPRGPQLRDLGSTNGTLINGVPVERAYLLAGATITIGQSELRVEATGETAEALSSEERWGRALGASPAMRRIFALLPRLAQSEATILLEGETGTGKSLLAEAIHEASPRARSPFVVVDCGAIPPTLIESELFGHERGAFTGATATRVGAFESAAGGTLFLDEIGELPLDMQPKLLRALEERVVKRVGGNESIRLDVRLIAASNRDLREEVNRGRFRSDLFYRLATLRLRVPALRDRREDIPLLVAHFYAQFVPGGQPSAELLASFLAQSWPGNVRELRAAVERAVLLDDPEVWGEICAAERGAGTPPAHAVVEEGVAFRAAKERAVAQWESAYVRALIQMHGGNLSRAARAVRMDRNHLRELLRRHGVVADD